MFFQNEIKDFIKNTLILTLFFTLVLHLSWGYIAPMIGLGASASQNDVRFTRGDMVYLGNIATAMSLGIWQKDTKISSTPIQLSNDIISIGEVLANPTIGQQKLIGGNMIAISTYNNILKTDIPSMLDGATDRTIALDEYMSILREYGNRTNERLIILDEQIADLNAIITKSAADTTAAKANMQSSYNNLDYTSVDVAIATYTEAKQADIRARVYLVYLENFRSLYTKLQTKNRQILEALSTNREALIKHSRIIIPNSGTDILKELDLIQTEAEAKAGENIE
jgi:hypothetical protein